jgi:hypothetical protein
MLNPYTGGAVPRPLGHRDARRHLPPANRDTRAIVDSRGGDGSNWRDLRPMATEWVELGNSDGPQNGWVPG